MGSCCPWVVGGTVITIGIGLLICLIIFMRGSSGATAEISGNQNEVENISNQDISLFHYTSLSEKIDNNHEIQGHHNKAKYFLFSVIFVGLALIVIYKCVVYKGKKKKKRRIREALELTELHNDSLTKHGILKNHKLTSWRKEEIEKSREIREKEKKEEKKGKKGRKKEGIEEEDDAWKQKLKAGAGEEAGEGAEDYKQKQRSKTKGKRWIEVDESE